MLEWVPARGSSIWHENHLGSQEAPHGVADENDIGIGRLVRLQPSAEIIPRNLNSLVCLVPGIQFGVNNMRF